VKSPHHQITNSPGYVALTRAVSPAIDRCELTHLGRKPIDFARAMAEHDAYEAALAALGCRIERLADLPDCPDGVFVEDIAVVLDDLAIVARPGAVSRRSEVESVVPRLGEWRRLARIDAPGTLDGGDVLVTPGHVWVGVSSRTNAEGARQLAAFVAPFGFATTCLQVTGCLHLKSAVTLAADRTLLLNPDWIDPASFPGFVALAIDPGEPFAANVLRIGDRVLCASEHPRTRARLEAHGITTLAVDAGELAKAEGSVTCCSLIISADWRGQRNCSIGDWRLEIGIED
jgi:dimethylargininase